MKLSGFTLLEMSVVMVIAGIAMASAGGLYRIYAERLALDKTSDNMTLIHTALQNYYIKNLKYPCPADPSLGLDNDLSGVSQCTPGGGVVRTTGRDTRADTDTNPDNILIGAVPYKSLDLGTYTENGNLHNYNSIGDAGTASTSLDGWGEQIIYAVSESQTATATFDTEGGAISLQTEYGDTLVSPVGSAYFVLASTGKDGVGGYSRDGAISKACGSVAGVDSENCDNDSTFVQGIRSEGAGATHYDDIVYYQKATATTLWTYEKDPITGKIQKNVYNLNKGNVGIGVASPTERLDVGGDIKALDFRSEYICDSTGTYCFEALSLGGSGMVCPSTATTLGLLTGIENGQPVCVSMPVPTSLPAFTCPKKSGKQTVLTGIGLDGSYQCESL